MDLSFWSAREYRNNWRRALERIGQKNTTTSCLISSITDPGNSNFISCWPLYRHGQNVTVQSSLIFLDELNEEFSEAEPWHAIAPHSSIDEDGNRISEWVTQVSDVRAFLDSHWQSRRQLRDG
ncbi:hypothetical protein [Streptomyces kronopolitis]|uniref:hypothetical protein n=1 Tax=Streptomyces kronopolitis TaxID=1612435 RepID=UPI0034138F04